jgi:hypothetical protein
VDEKWFTSFKVEVRKDVSVIKHHIMKMYRGEEL